MILIPIVKTMPCTDFYLKTEHFKNVELLKLELKRLSSCYKRTTALILHFYSGSTEDYSRNGHGQWPLQRSYFSTSRRREPLVRHWRWGNRWEPPAGWGSSGAGQCVIILTSSVARGGRDVTSVRPAVWRQSDGCMHSAIRLKRCDVMRGQGHGQTYLTRVFSFQHFS